MLVVTVKQGKHWQCWLNTLFPFSQTLYFSLKPAAISKWDFQQQQKMLMVLNHFTSDIANDTLHPAVHQKHKHVFQL